ncbi:DnaJ domain-containing protein [Nocardioides sp.]|uniref:J domain-containing protein n=1 Tax=Nocardioides sp. TaxID=35761 RepID=UPI00271AB3A4|nr:DnaJ domain-containing protein [Nocardioides sp.]MDO9456323.1 DnaJ domain-containing protein [Nocardioides sp.]
MGGDPVTPSWYDVLGVDETATADEIRAAWQESVAGLDPTDRRFKQRNRAAEVLLDPERRAAHDADLAAQDPDEDDLGGSTDVVDPETPTGASAAPDTAVRVRTRRTAEAGDEGEPGTSRVALAVGLGIVALVLVVATVVALVAGGGSTAPAAADDDGLPDARQVQAARAAAETAIGPVLSYDYRTLDKSRAAATSFMTPAYADEYDKNFAVIEENAPKSQTIVTAQVVSSGIVRTGDDRVDVLVFVNRPTRNVSKDVVSRDQVTVRMLDVDGSWLVDCLVTSPGGTCGD